MKLKHTKSIKLKLTGNEGEVFKSVINKINEEHNKVGFSNSTLTTDERDLIKSISNKLDK